MLKKITLSITLAVTASSFSFAANNSELYIHDVVSIPESHYSIAEYYNSGEYDQDVATITQKAIDFTANYLKAHPEIKKPAFVFDIDDTLLTSYKFESSHGFMLNINDINNSWENPTNLELNKPLMPLYDYARKHDIAIFIVTGRSENFRKVTEKDLSYYNLDEYKTLYLKPENAHFKSVVNYKAQVRKEIENKGYDIILTVGDQDSDLKGGYAVKMVKLPNPMYFLP
ncbi:MAG: HAD family acid phosphatase [Francisellaceae bacterium]